MSDANTTAVPLIEGMVRSLGPPTQTSEPELSAWLGGLSASQLVELCAELLKVLGYDVLETSVLENEAVFAISSLTQAQDLVQLSAVCLLNRPGTSIVLNGRDYEERLGRKVAHLFAIRNDVGIVPEDHPVSLWRSTGIARLLLAVLHSEFSLTDFTYYPPSLRQHSLRNLAEGLSLTVDQLLRIDKIWRQLRGDAKS